MKEKKIQLEINGKDYSVVIEEFSAHDALVKVNGKEYKVGIKDLGIEQVSDIRPKMEQSAPSPAAGQSPIKLHRPKSLIQASSVTAPLPGLVQKLLVSAGDSVEAGQKVVIMEAMKMENEIQSKINGIVKEIKVKEGESIEEGAVIMILE